MTKSEHLALLEQSVRATLRKAYLHGASCMGHNELAMSLGRARTTKGFHADIKRLWTSEMDFLGYDEDEMPSLRYCWVSGVNEWLFVYEGTRDDEKLEWLSI